MTDEARAREYADRVAVGLDSELFAPVSAAYLAATAAEREACARVVEDFAAVVHPIGAAATAGYRAAVKHIVATIRRRT